MATVSNRVNWVVPLLHTHALNIRLFYCKIFRLQCFQLRESNFDVFTYYAVKSLSKVIQSSNLVWSMVYHCRLCASNMTAHNQLLQKLSTINYRSLNKLSSWSFRLGNGYLAELRKFTLRTAHRMVHLSLQQVCKLNFLAQRCTVQKCTKNVCFYYYYYYYYWEHTPT